MTKINGANTAFYEQACKDVASMSGIDMTLVKPLLENLGKLYGYLDELSNVIDTEGAMVENPALASFTKVAGRAGGLARQISAFTKNAPIAEDDDGFDNFDA